MRRQRDWTGSSCLLRANRHIIIRFKRTLGGIRSGSRTTEASKLGDGRFGSELPRQDGFITQSKREADFVHTSFSGIINSFHGGSYVLCGC